MASGRLPARILSIAGSDSGGGAGIQADLKSVEAFGGFGMTAITAVTAQNTRGVFAIEEVSSELITKQMTSVLDDLGADAIKIGLLPTTSAVEAVARVLADYPPCPLVLDPVLVATSGDRLGDSGVGSALRRELFERTTLLTPNLPETAELVGAPVARLPERIEAARVLVGEGCSAVLITGGHGEDDPLVDMLFDGRQVHRIEHPRIEGGARHGTGCTLSAAIATGLGQGLTLEAAVRRGIGYVAGAISASYGLGDGASPLNHGFRSTTARS